MLVVNRGAVASGQPQGPNTMTDNIAILQGYTKEVLLDGSIYTLNALVKPDADLGDRFKAWDMDEQEFIWVNGWLFDSEVIEPSKPTREEFTQLHNGRMDVMCREHKAAVKLPKADRKVERALVKEACIMAMDLLREWEHGVEA